MDKICGIPIEYFSIEIEDAFIMPGINLLELLGMERGKRSKDKTSTSRKKFSKAVLSRDEQCRAIIDETRCRNKATDPHHITGRISVIDDVPVAGIGMCRMHHSQVTDGIIKVQASWLTPDQIAWIEKRKWPGWGKIIWNQK